LALIDLDGTLDGVGDLSGVLALLYTFGGPLPGLGDVAATPAYWINISGTLSGVASVSTPSPVSIFLLGGQAYGYGTVRDDLLIDLFGTMSGVGNLSGSLVHLQPLYGAFYGTGDLLESVPLPLQGFGTLQAFMEVLTTPKPYCPRPGALTTFSFMQTLQKGDLTLCITDAFGNNYSPVSVTFAMYEILPGGYRQLRGPPARKPVMGFCGIYYATGAAGECGQPGNWCIVWTWQRGPGFPTECRTDFFTVQDAAMRNPCDPARKRKFGWKC